MPYDQSRYSGIEYYGRFFGSSLMTIGVTALFTYPLDLIHTRISSDITKKNEQRLFSTTFDCFNRTGLDEGNKALYKGVEVAATASAIRCMATLPLYDMLRSQKSSSFDFGIPQLKNFNEKMGIAFFSSFIMSLFLYPFDTVKKNLQLNGARGHL